MSKYKVTLDKVEDTVTGDRIKLDELGSLVVISGTEVVGIYAPGSWYKVCKEETTE